MINHITLTFKTLAIKIRGEKIRGTNASNYEFSNLRPS